MIVGDHLAVDLGHAQIPQGHGGEDACGDIVPGADDTDIRPPRSDPLQHTDILTVTHRSTCGMQSDLVDSRLGDIDGNDIVPEVLQRLCDGRSKVSKSYNDETFHGSFYLNRLLHLHRHTGTLRCRFARAALSPRRTSMVRHVQGTS